VRTVLPAVVNVLVASLAYCGSYIFGRDRRVGRGLLRSRLILLRRVGWFLLGLSPNERGDQAEREHQSNSPRHSGVWHRNSSGRAAKGFQSYGDSRRRNCSILYTPAKRAQFVARYRFITLLVWPRGYSQAGSRERLLQRLSSIGNRLDPAYLDKLHGKISEELIMVSKKRKLACRRATDSNGNPLRFKCLHIASLNITISASVETWFSGEMDARPCRLLQPAATNNQLPDRLLRKLSARAA
jgi:hypothetical protein